MKNRFVVALQDFVNFGGLYLVVAGLFAVSAVLQLVVLVAKLLS